LAAAELAAAVCVEQEAFQPSATPDTKSQPVIKYLLVRPTRAQELTAPSNLPAPSFAGAEPHFARLAMCERSETGAAPIVQPLVQVGFSRNR
jgi:hypothetical protein